MNQWNCFFHLKSFSSAWLSIPLHFVSGIIRLTLQTALRLFSACLIRIEDFGLKESNARLFRRDMTKVFSARAFIDRETATAQAPCIKKELNKFD